MRYNIETLNADFSEKFEKRLTKLTSSLLDEYSKIFTVLNVQKEHAQPAMQEMCDHVSDNFKKQSAVFIEMLNKISRSFHAKVT